MMYKIAILLSILLVLTFSEAEALRNDKQEIIKEYDNFNRHITLNPDMATEDRIELIKEVIFSDEIITIPDIVLHKGPVGFETDYYLGWQAALNQVQETELTFDISSRPGDIDIMLFSHKSDFSGRTLFIGDRVQIILYDVDEYTPNSLKTLLRHELGHAFGLGHTTASEELMHPIINQDYPYISSCNIMALSSNNQTDFTCLK